MDLVALSVALAAFLAAGLAHREAVRSSSRKLATKVHDELEDLETFKRNLKRDWEEERDRLGKQARRTGATIKRLEEIMEDDGSGSDGSEGADVPGPDARGSETRRVPPVRQNVVGIPWRGGRTG